MNTFLQRPFYPLIFAIYPTVYLAAHNAGIISPADPLRPILLALGIAALLLGYLRLVFKEWHRAALLTMVMLALFFSFGHIANMIPPGSEGVQAWMWLGAFLALAFGVMRFRQAKVLTPALNAISLLMLVFSLVTLAQFALWKNSGQADGQDARALLANLRGDEQAQQNVTTPSPAPDIYYIVLDSYERADALEKYYGFDNSEFQAALRERGFYIAEESRSNYLTTTFSLPSTLNMVFLDELPKAAFLETVAGLKVNHVVDFLRAHGYRSVHFASGFTGTDSVDPDVFAAPGMNVDGSTADGPSISQFELLLLQTTLGRLLFPTATGETDLTGAQVSVAINQDFDLRRERIEYALTHLPDYAADPQPDYVFAHLILPHNPYLYDKNGTPIDYNGREFLLGDKTNTARNIQLYTDQLQYTNTRVIDLIDRILATAETPPVIILQADHGHDTFFEFETPTPEGVDLRSAILNAVYFPGEDYGNLYTSITPVNTFRVVFNQFFGAQYPLLPDQVYMHPRRDPNPMKAVQEFTPADPFLEQVTGQ